MEKQELQAVEKDTRKILYGGKIKKATLFRFGRFFRPWPVLRLLLLDLFFACIIAGSAIGMPYLTQLITKSASDSEFYWLYFGIGFFALLIVLQVSSQWIVSYWGHLMGVRMEINMRRETVKKMHKLKMSYYDKTPIGSFISRMVSDLRDIPEFAHHAPEDFLIATITGVGGFTYAFLQSWIIGLVFIFIFLVGIVIILKVNRKWRVIWEHVRENNSEMSANIGRQAEGITEIKSYAAEHFEGGLFEKMQQKYFVINKRFYFLEGLASSASMFIMMASTFLATVAGGILVAYKQITLPQMIGLTTAAAVLNQPINRFVAVYNMLARGASSVTRFFDFMNLPEEENAGKVIQKIKGTIEFRNVNFKYEKDNQKMQVLRDFNLIIKPGESVALVGETGIGKSTILKLLLRFYEIDSGEILIDGVNIKDYDIFNLRQQIGYIQQAPIIFDDTIRNNILYGKPEANDDEIKRALDLSYVTEFLEKTTKGLETVVGPRGAMLSGGQRQRLSIARAVLAGSPVLLLDEATSALDNETESKIKVSLDNLARHATTLVVAHRLSTIKDVDRVIVLGAGGVILEEGKFDELEKNPSSKLHQLNNIQQN